MNQFSDEKIFKLFQEGDKKAFDQLVIKYKDRLYNFIYRIVNDVDLAEDLTQDTYVKVYLNKNSYKEIYKFSTWMYTIAKNLAFTELRKKNRRKTFAFSDMKKNDDWDFQVADTDSGNIDNEINNKEKKKNIQKALSLLPIDFRTIIILRDIQELNRGREKLYHLLKGKDIV